MQTCTSKPSLHLQGISSVVPYLQMLRVSPVEVDDSTEADKIFQNPSSNDSTPYVLYGDVATSN